MLSLSELDGPGNKINIGLKEEPPSRAVLLLRLRKGEGVLAVVVLNDLVVPVVTQSVTDLVRGEALRPLVARFKDFLRRHRLVAHHAEGDFLRLVVGDAVRVALRVQTLILGVDFLAQNRQVNSLVAVQVVADGFQSVLLHSVMSFLVCWVFLPFDVFIIAPIGYNVKLRVC